MIPYALQNVLRMILLVAAAATVGVLYQSMHPAGLRLFKRPSKVSAVGSGEEVRHTLLSARWLPTGNPGATPQVRPLIEGGGVQRPPDSTARVCTWAEVEVWLREARAVLVDVRPAAAFQAGHIPGALSFPLDQLMKSPAEFIKSHPPGAKNVVLYCSNLRCSQSGQAADLLMTKHGYPEVWHVPGGFFEWRELQEQRSQE